ARDQLLSEYKAASRSKIRSVYSDGYNLGYLGQPDIDEEELSSPHRALRRAVRLAQLRRYVGAEHEEDSPTPPDGDSGSGRPPSASESAKTEAGEAAWHPSTATTTHKVRLTPGIPVFSAEEPVSEQLDTGAPNMAIDSEADTEGATYSGVEAETGEVPVAEADEEQSSAPASSAAEVDQPEPTASPEQSPESTLIKPSLEMRPEEGSRDAGDGEVRDVED
ncbi:MAG TPA: hypothetical protein VHG28_10455, partial [Longimicrobiaceae bacterium]|nr:hypothetical protein [Longimicrobiaceae bacterium]